MGPSITATAGSGWKVRATLSQQDEAAFSGEVAAVSRRAATRAGGGGLPDELLVEAAERFGTPTYLYDLTHVTDQVRRLAAAFGPVRIHYALKANANGALLEHLVGLGLGAEALTLGELERALRAGFPPERIALGGPGHTPQLARRALEVGVTLVSLDGSGAHALWEEALDDSPGAGVRYLVRLNPGFDPRTHEHLATAAASSKFGVPPAEAAAIAERAAGRLAGFHLHAGSMLEDAAVADLVVDALEPLYRRFRGLELVDLGGGFTATGEGAPLEAFARAYRAFAERHAVTPLIEPGRSVVAGAGLLLTRVLHVKEGERRHVIADAGMSDLLRPALYAATHPVRVLGRGDEPALGSPTDVDGPLCENADRLARDAALPGVSAGDLLAVSEVGAYGFAMASNYASSLRPAEVIWDGTELALARKRERPEDLWRLEEGL